MAGRAAPSSAFVTPAYRHAPGAHCAGAALRDLLRHHGGPAWTEAFLVGAGSCLTFLAVNLDDFDEAASEQATAAVTVAGPSRAASLQATARPFFCTGWSVMFGRDVQRALALDMVEGSAADDDDAAWAAVRDLVAANTPVIIHGDIYHLWYKPRMHFAAHQYMLVGYDEDEGYALVVERSYPEPLKVPLADLRLSRNPPEGAHIRINTWTYLRSGATRTDLVPAVLHAIYLTARRMLDGDIGESPETGRPMQASADAGLLWIGLPGMRQLRAALPVWRQRIVPAALQMRLSDMSQLMSKHGSGGAFFRNTFVSFLREVVPLAGLAWITPDDVRRAQAAADGWDRLAAVLDRLSRSPTPDNPLWADADASLGAVHDAEHGLFVRLAARLQPFADEPPPARPRL